tara:strand:+ start:329 stop:667 length:339 start_codon:yes stop_codon:yes gene_type:complete
MYFSPRVILGFILAFSLLVKPSLHFIHVCMGTCQIAVSCTSGGDHSNCGTSDKLSTEKECKLCEMLATSTWAYHFTEHLNKYSGFIDEWAACKAMPSYLFVKLFLARAPPLL